MTRAVPGLESFCQGCNINLSGGYAEHEADHNAALHAVVERLQRGKEMINIKGYDKARVLKALYNGSQPMGMGFLQARPGDMTDDQARELLTTGDDSTRMFDRVPRLYFDYVYGRPLKVDLSGDELDPRLYDRDHGHGAAQRVIEAEFSEK